MPIRYSGHQIPGATMTKNELIHRTQGRVAQMTARCAELREQRRELLLVKPINITLVHLLAEQIRDREREIVEEERLLKKWRRMRVGAVRQHNLRANDCPSNAQKASIQG
jgi:hypothetical protein